MPIVGNSLIGLGVGSGDGGGSGEVSQQDLDNAIQGLRTEVSQQYVPDTFVLNGESLDELDSLDLTTEDLSGTVGGSTWSN